MNNQETASAVEFLNVNFIAVSTTNKFPFTFYCTEVVAEMSKDSWNKKQNLHDLIALQERGEITDPFNFVPLSQMRLNEMSCQKTL